VSVLDLLLGRRLASNEERAEQIGTAAGVRGSPDQESVHPEIGAARF
jgi:hypothetical protein